MVHAIQIVLASAEIHAVSMVSEFETVNGSHDQEEVSYKSEEYV
jgi:hypothetical protein